MKLSPTQKRMCLFKQHGKGDIPVLATFIIRSQINQSLLISIIILPDEQP